MRNGHKKCLHQGINTLFYLVGLAGHHASSPFNVTYKVECMVCIIRVDNDGPFWKTLSTRWRHSHAITVANFQSKIFLNEGICLHKWFLYETNNNTLPHDGTNGFLCYNRNHTVIGMLYRKNM